MEQLRVEASGTAAARNERNASAFFVHTACHHGKYHCLSTSMLGCLLCSRTPRKAHSVPVPVVNKLYHVSVAVASFSDNDQIKENWTPWRELKSHHENNTLCFASIQDDSRQFLCTTLFHPTLLTFLITFLNVIY